MIFDYLFNVLLRLKLQELLSTLKAKDKNLEYDMQTLNDKISAYKIKINDSQATLNELNGKLDETRRSFASKQAEVENAERELNAYTMKLNRLAQEKLYLVEQQKNLNQDSPFAEEYRHDALALKNKQSAVQHLRAELENVETQMNAARTLLEIRKHELEVSRADENELMKENTRLAQLLELKKGNANIGGSVSAIRSNFMKQSESINSGLTRTASPVVNGVVKTSQSTSSLRSNTPKGKY